MHCTLPSRTHRASKSTFCAIPGAGSRWQVSWLADCRFTHLPGLMASGIPGVANRSQLRGQPRIWSLLGTPHRVPSLVRRAHKLSGTIVDNCETGHTPDQQKSFCWLPDRRTAVTFRQLGTAQLRNVERSIYRLQSATSPCLPLRGHPATIPGMARSIAFQASSCDFGDRRPRDHLADLLVATAATRKS